MNPAFKQDPSATTSFSRIKNAAPVVGRSKPLRAVVIGGGTGAPVSIKTLVSLGVETSAVVAMADDGGSTGKLREKANVTPPGDVRKCLVAFAADPDDPLTQASAPVRIRRQPHSGQPYALRPGRRHGIFP